MDENELALELINFLNETGNYNNFVEWSVERGYDRNVIESKMTSIENQ